MSVKQIKTENENNTESKINTQNIDAVWIEVKEERIKDEPADQDIRNKFDKISPYADNLNKVLTYYSDNNKPHNACNGIERLNSIKEECIEDDLKKYIEINVKPENRISERKTFKCEQCNTTYRTEGDLSKHLDYSMVHNYGKCNQCNKTFKTEDHLRKHLDYCNVHTLGDLIHSCHKCYSSFTSVSSLKHHTIQKHMKPHASKGDIISKIYQNRVISGKITVKRPIKKQVLKNVFGRKFVNTDFVKQKKELKQLLASNEKNSYSHRDIQDNVQLEDYKEESKVGLKNTSSLKTEDYPEGKIPNAPEPQDFLEENSQILMQKDEREEKVKKRKTSIRPYHCDECGRGVNFKQRGDLNYHIKSKHSDKTEFQCEFCGKEFARKYSLTLHRKIHTGELSHPCDVCDKSFRAAVYLQTHRRIHTGEKPYSCELCSKKFRTKSNVNRHMTIHSQRELKKISQYGVKYLLNDGRSQSSS